MNRKFLIPVLLFAFFFSFSSKSVIAEDIQLKYNTDFTSDITNASNVFDSSAATYGTIPANSGPSITFLKPVDITTINTSLGHDFTFRFYNVSTEKIGEIIVGSGNRITGVNLKNVTRFSVINTNQVTANLYNISIFGGVVNQVKPSVKSVDIVPDITGAKINFVLENATSARLYNGDTVVQGNKIDYFTLTDLKPDTTYTFNIIATDTNGNQGLPYPVTFKTLPDPIKVPPGQVLSFFADDIGIDSAVLKWKNPIDTDLSKAVIYDSKNEKVVELDTSETSFSLKGLKPSTAYSYSIKMLDKDGNYSVATSVSFSTKEEEKDLIAPATPTIIRVSSGDSVIDAVWTFNSESDFAGYNIYLDGVKVNDTPYKHDNYRFSSLENGRVYKIEVEAVDTSGNKSEKMAVNGSPVAPKVPNVSLAGINLKDVADGIANWFGGLWLIIVFAVAIPLALWIATRIKQLFLR